MASPSRISPYGIQTNVTRRLLLSFASILPLASILPILAAAELGGTWNMVWDTEGGIRKNDWKISQDGESLTVESDGQVFKGTFKSNRMVVEGRLYSAEAGYTATLKVEGTLDPDGTLKGRGSWDQYAMTFTAKRAE